MLKQFCDWLQGTPLALYINQHWFPLVESIHVIAIALVVGTIFIVDLRLIGLASRHLGVQYLTERVTPWTWRAFGLAVVTGLLMFVANASTYYDNGPFRIKLCLLALAGLNMAYFQLFTYKRVSEWDTGRPGTSARFAGCMSLLLWTAIVVTGRWIGFTD